MKNAGYVNVRATKARKFCNQKIKDFNNAKKNL